MFSRDLPSPVTFAALGASYSVMVDSGLKQRFEEALTPAIYQIGWRYALRLTMRREDAEDLLQESLVRAFQRFKQLRDIARFKGWFLSIMRMLHIDRLRRASARPQEVSELPQLADATADPLCREIAEALAQLPTPQHELLSLFYIDGLNLNETGEVLGIKPQVVRQRLYRARQALRRQLDSTPAADGTPCPGGGDYHESY